MRARGLPQMLGTASALLTCQALQHGNTTAKWLLQPFGGDGASSAGAISAAAVQLPDDVVESCLLGRGSPQSCLAKLLAGSSSGSSSSSSSSAAAGIAPAALPTTTTANIILAGLAARGCTAEALQLFNWMQGQQTQQAQQSSKAMQAPCAPDWWTHQLLLFAALNGPREQQLELTLRAVREAR